MREEIILVDPYDHEIGTCEKITAHRERRLHRAFSLFVADGSGSLLIQRRAAGKYHSAGLWCNACCSHPRKGEMLPEAVSRRAAEELGISAFPLGEPEEIFSFVYYADYGELAEYEYDHVFLARLGRDTVFHPAPEEIGELTWISFSALERALLEHPYRFAAWFLTAAPRVMAMLRGGQDG
ncbi:isopentenyl-diphosphate Delta-isomerase [Clostridium vitabionis]|uniref:isopentenyl-diphosphate Delta-isomerase n=1 Tax=Clostridium vitabionis TaxID=2784388 RepID=UPI00188D1E43|nr:isopentenyl-diphosphate Delta-isomerase [Clostridium vitabionis]